MHIIFILFILVIMMLKLHIIFVRRKLIHEDPIIIALFKF